MFVSSSRKSSNKAAVSLSVNFLSISLSVFIVGVFSWIIMRFINLFYDEYQHSLYYV